MILLTALLCLLTLTTATTSNKTTPFSLPSTWGNLSPYTPSPGFGIPPGTPQQCQLTQAHILHRHAQRYPTSYLLDADSMESFAQKLQNYTKAHPNSTLATGPLSFLNKWRYLMGTEALLPTGAATEATSGAFHWSRYGRVLYDAPAGMADWSNELNVWPNGTRRDKPMFRTTSQARILESARWWLSGFFSNIAANSSADNYDLVIIPEGDGYNNTLSGSCPNGDTEEGDDSAEQFLRTYTPPIITRLTPHLPSTLNLTALDILSMQNLCAYETAVLGSSSFCALFTPSEWESFAYILDLQFYGDYGFGSPSGRAQGIGYVIELAARLQGKLITEQVANVNITYDSNPETFPLHQPLYLDMSHDDVIVSVLAALGVEYFNIGEDGMRGDIGAEEVPLNRTFRLNHIAPFGARFVTEVWRCEASSAEEIVVDGGGEVVYENDVVKEGQGREFVRWVLNEMPVPVDGVSGCEGDAAGGNGFCALEGFLGGVGKMQELAAFEAACIQGAGSGGGQVGDGRP